ncbi:MAG: glycosyl transferase, partial [Acetobacteraceae bacterium]
MMSIVRRILGHASPDSPWISGKPVREELFSAERLEQHARSLALAQTVTPRPTRGHPLSGRLASNSAILLHAYRTITKSVEAGRAITPAAEWLIDNYYLVEREVREIRFALPPGYYRQLPKLLAGPLAGYPRVFGVAWAFVAHTDSHFEADMLYRFVRAYQEVQPLTIGELWAVAITLRIVLVENLRRLAALIIRSSDARQEANDIADRLLGVGGHAAEPASTVLVHRDGTSLSDAFAVQLVHRLRDQDRRITPALTWLDQHLAAQGSTADTIVHDEHQRQGSGVVTVRNIITSMRVISDTDWPDLFERISLVDDTLSAGTAFRDMDFPTRNLYRSAIEDLSRGANRTELDVTRAAVQTANQAACSSARVEQDRNADPGYHLLAGGRRAFEAAIGFRASSRAWPGHLGHRLGIGGYVGAGSMVAAVLLAIPLLTLYAQGVGPAWLGLLGILGAVPAIDVAVAMVNRAVTRGFGATPLPALELRSGIPVHLRTLIAVPTLLTRADAIEEQIGLLEVHHLASPEGELHFALVSDWLDAPTQNVAGDESLLETATAGIARLNRRYGRG